MRLGAAYRNMCFRKKELVKARWILVRNEMEGELHLLQKYFENWGIHGVVD